MEFAFTTSYLVTVFAVTIATLLMMIFGGWVTNRIQKGGLRFGFANKTRFHRKFWGFVLFIITIFLLGFLSERLQQTLYNYFKIHFTTSITGIIVMFLVAWFLYDWLVWKKHNG
ncbi:TPA: hypothetical protein HA251_04230 [Candidatus Woesearchaeota archaeon]|nr:hypothetical protein [Candidatus Woesearchaeota archaeon]